MLVQNWQHNLDCAVDCAVGPMTKLLTVSWNMGKRRSHPFLAHDYPISPTCSKQLFCMSNCINQTLVQGIWNWPTNVWVRGKMWRRKVGNEFGSFWPINWSNINIFRWCQINMAPCCYLNSYPRGTEFDPSMGPLSLGWVSLTKGSLEPMQPPSRLSRINGTPWLRVKLVATLVVMKLGVNTVRWKLT